MWLGSVLLWLWCRLAPLPPLAWELPSVSGAALKEKQKSEVQRGEVVCPRSHSMKVAKPGWTCRSARLRVCPLACVAPGTWLPSPSQGSGSACLSFPARETGEQMTSVKPADSQASMAREGHLRGLGKAGVAPPGPRRPPHPQGTKSAASHQSSLTSLEGSGISERLPQKSLCQAGRPALEVSVHVGRGSEPPGHSLHLLELSASGLCSECLLFLPQPVINLPSIQSYV